MTLLRRLWAGFVALFNTPLPAPTWRDLRHPVIFWRDFRRDWP